MYTRENLMEKMDRTMDLSLMITKVSRALFGMAEAFSALEDVLSDEERDAMVYEWFGIKYPFGVETGDIYELAMSVAEWNDQLDSTMKTLYEGRK